MLSLILGYRVTLTAYTSETIIAPSVLRWGFQSGGTLTANFTGANSGALVVALCTSDEIKKMAEYKFLNCDTFAQMCSTAVYQETAQGKANFYLKVPARARYYTAIASCRSFSSIYQVDLHYANPDSKLSTDLIPCLYAKPIMAVLFAICLVYWFINWALNCKGSSLVHKVFTAAFVLALLTVLVDCGYYAHFNKSDSNNGVAEATVVFACFFMFITISCFVLTSNGFGIIHNNYTYKDIGLILLLDAIMIGTIYGYRYAKSFWLSLVLLVVFAIALYFVIRIVMKGTRMCMIQIYAHMYVIAERGIDPTTTPLKKKLTIYRMITYILVIYLGLTVMLQLVFAIFGIPEWIYQFFADLVNLSLVIGAMYLFRLERARGGYASLASSEPQQPQEFTIEDIERLDFNTIFNNATQTWDGETPLPPMPRIVEVPTHVLENDQEIEVQPSPDFQADVDIPAPATTNANAPPPPLNNVAPIANPYNNEDDESLRV